MLYFSPKDNTPGCTTQGADFRDPYSRFRQGFKSKLQFPFELLSDADAAVCKAFGVTTDKLMFGRKVRGIERSTFEWRGVKVPGHVQEVSNFVKAL